MASHNRVPLSRKAQQRRDSLRAGVRLGLTFAAIYSAYALVLLIVRGFRPFERVAGGILGVLAFYAIAGAASGAIAGSLATLGRRWYGAMLVGFIAAVPAGLAASALVVKPEEWAADFLPVAFGGAGLLGPLCGLGFWAVNRATP